MPYNNTLSSFLLPCHIPHSLIVKQNTISSTLNRLKSIVYMLKSSGNVGLPIPFSICYDFSDFCLSSSQTFLGHCVGRPTQKERDFSSSSCVLVNTVCIFLFCIRKGIWLLKIRIKPHISRGQAANPSLPGKWSLKRCVLCVFLIGVLPQLVPVHFLFLALCTKVIWADHS